MKFREMTTQDHAELITLFEKTEGVTVREADSFEATKFYLERNPGLNFVAVDNEKIIGCVMCGHDGRRGYMQHLVVSESYRKQGIGEHLVNLCLQSLEKFGIDKTHLFVFRTNDLANQFWSKRGWQIRDDLNMYSFNRSSNLNA